ncbi:voltage-gated chloride channel family protein [Paenibacillus profundus]|uniref:Voltage-gated chloride channel family protein n=1 Tax=Paenibacillus profundus TaxID=1173085 RepID=A0ABS8YPF9_9BACL|nr:voltage-gated chloride channel family protein [Paenibacillus profundus]MCE5173069.1 voltage-gated chloride channel family protein [Paenibacillus profundus]
MEKLKLQARRLAKKQLHAAILFYVLKWILLGGVVGIITGSASAFFLTSLEWATDMRLQYSWLLFLLPIGGAAVSYLYKRYGNNASKGNNLILEQINTEAQEHVPFRMAPLVLFGTIITHLFGGSAGREGTAVQMGGSLSEWIGKCFKLDALDRKIILICGISSGFGSVFGTPLAGTFFAIEVLAIGMFRHSAIFPSFVASLVGDRVTAAWGVHHSHYTIGAIPEMTLPLILKVCIAAILFGLTSILFSELTHRLKKGFSFLFKNPMLKSFVGGVIVIGLVYLVGTRDYIGLGLPLLSQAFDGEVAPGSFFLKTVFTSVTLGAGFQGGEVTPLFVIGATLGNALAALLQVSAPFMAALGMVAVFSGATNTPLACFVMGIELFGSEASVYLFMVCVVSYLFSGHTGIYTSQMIGVSKSRLFPYPKASTLDSVHSKQNKEEN